MFAPPVNLEAPLDFETTQGESDRVCVLWLWDGTVSPIGCVGLLVIGRYTDLTLLCVASSPENLGFHL